MQAKVRDKIRGIERTITAKAYSIIPHRYELLGWINEDGTPSETGPSNQEVGGARLPEKKRSVAEVVEDNKLHRYKQPVTDEPKVTKVVPEPEPVVVEPEPEVVTLKKVKKATKAKTKSK